MKIITYNVNGIRSAIDKGFYDFLAQENPDVIGLQEIKALAEQVDTTRLKELGYKDYWYSAQKKGYSGTAIFCKQEPDFVQTGMGISAYDDEGRVLRADFGDLTVLSCYFPSGSSGDTRQDVKMNFLNDFYIWANELRKSRPNLVIMGDYNIAHHNIDIHDPKGNKDSSGFLPEERDWMTKWFEAGYVDTYRHLYPTSQKYSWWSFRSGARGNNKGWRIDYISVSEPLRERIREAHLLNDAVHSDHCPCVLELAD